MSPAKKLVSETAEQEEQQDKPLPEHTNTRTQNVIKLLIMMLLTYAIIFM